MSNNQPDARLADELEALLQGCDIQGKWHLRVDEVNECFLLVDVSGKAQDKFSASIHGRVASFVDHMRDSEKKLGHAELACALVNNLPQILCALRSPGAAADAWISCAPDSMPVIDKTDSRNIDSEPVLVHARFSDDSFTGDRTYIGRARYVKSSYGEYWSHDNLGITSLSKKMLWQLPAISHFPIMHGVVTHWQPLPLPPSQSQQGV